MNDKGGWGWKVIWRKIEIALHQRIIDFFFIIVNKEQKLAQDWRIIYHNRMKFINHVENIVYVNLDFLGAFVLEKKKRFSRYFIIFFSTSQGYPSWKKPFLRIQKHALSFRSSLILTEAFASSLIQKTGGTQSPSVCFLII